MSGPTLSDVANAAGVSYATADRVVNNRGNVAQKSIEKVRDAVTHLGYVRNVAAANLSRKRVYRLAFLIPTGPNAFFSLIREHILETANHLSGESVTVEIVDVSAFSVRALQNSIGQLTGYDYDGVAIVGLQSAELIAPLEQLRAKDVAVIGLVSDLPQDSRATYIGIDNRVAGRTAARMVGIAHAGQAGQVQTFAGSMDARDHSERLAGFCDVIAADFPEITICDPIITNDAADILQVQTQTLLEKPSNLTALYNVGAGNSGLIDALRMTTQKRPFCVVHELGAHSRQALLDGHIDLIIDQRPEVEINRAFTVLRALIDAIDLPVLPDLVPTIYVADNLPAETRNDPMKAKDT